MTISSLTIWILSSSVLCWALCSAAARPVPKRIGATDDADLNKSFPRFLWRATLLVGIALVLTSCAATSQTITRSPLQERGGKGGAAELMKP